MKKIIVICLILLINSCASVRATDLPEYWEYSPGKWVGFKEKVELAWDYDESKIDEFEIDREKLEIADYFDIKEIKKLIKERKSDELIEKEKILREKINWDDRVTKYRPSEERSFKDEEYPPPKFGQICFYQVSALKKGSPPSPHAEISIILVEK